MSVSKRGTNKTNLSGHVRSFHLRWNPAVWTQCHYRVWNQPVFNFSDGCIRFISGELKPKHWKPFSRSASVSRVLTQFWHQSVVQALQNVWTCQHMVIVYRFHATGAVNTHGNRHTHFTLLIATFAYLFFFFFPVLCHTLGQIFAILGGIWQPEGASQQRCVFLQSFCLSVWAV